MGSVTIDLWTLVLGAAAGLAGVFAGRGRALVAAGAGAVAALALDVGRDLL